VSFDRRLRIRSTEHDGVYHISYHISAGLASEIGPYPFDDEARYARLLDRIRKALVFNTVEIGSICTMGNHLHMLVIGHPDPPGLKKAAARYNRRYPDCTPLNPADPAHHAEIRRQALLQADVGNFCKRIFSAWGREIMEEIRRESPVDSRGRPRPLFFSPWAGSRHNEVNVVSRLAVLIMAVYITVNQWRAGLPPKPADCLPRNTLDFLNHPDYRNIVAGFPALMNILYPGPPGHRLSFGEKRATFRRACEGEKQRLSRAAAEGCKPEVDIDGDGSLNFDPEDPDGSPYLSLCGVIGLESDVRRHLTECGLSELAGRRLKHAANSSGLCSLFLIRPRHRPGTAKSAPDAANSPPDTA
jgi:hypothetical protein